MVVDTTESVMNLVLELSGPCRDPAIAKLRLVRVVDHQADELRRHAHDARRRIPLVFPPTPPTHTHPHRPHRPLVNTSTWAELRAEGMNGLECSRGLGMGPNEVTALEGTHLVAALRLRAAVAVPVR